MPVNANNTEGAIHGDREAFEMIIRTHSRTLFGIAYGILQNREEAEDVVQDSLVKAWKMRWRVRAIRQISCLAQNDRTPSRQRNDSANTDPFLLLTKQPKKATPTRLKPVRIDRQLHSALATLPELHRAALTLRYFEEMDYRTIENTLGLTNGARRGISAALWLRCATISPRSRFNGLNLWQSFTTKSITGSLLIFMANFPMKNSASYILISSIAPRAEKLIRKPKP